MSSNTLVEADIWTVAQTDQGNVVFVRPKGSDTVVPIFIGQLETQAILIGLGRLEVARPLTHDMVLAAFGQLGASVLRVEICDLVEGTYYARLLLIRDMQEIVVDSRPSDALALAVRSNVPIFIAENIVESSGIPVDMIREVPGTGLRDPEKPAAGQESAGEEEKTSPENAENADISEVDPALAEEIAEDRKAILREALERAIAEEDYERAAEIRDELSGLGPGR